MSKSSIGQAPCRIGQHHRGAAWCCAGHRLRNRHRARRGGGHRRDRRRHHLCRSSEPLEPGRGRGSPAGARSRRARRLLQSRSSVLCDPGTQPRAVKRGLHIAEGGPAPSAGPQKPPRWLPPRRPPPPADDRLTLVPQAPSAHHGDPHRAGVTVEPQRVSSGDSSAILAGTAHLRSRHNETGRRWCSVVNRTGRA